MSSRSHCKSTSFQIIIIALTVSLGLLPVAPTTSAAAGTAVGPVSTSEAVSDTVVLKDDEKKNDLTEEKEEDDTDELESSEQGMSTTTKVAIGVGAAVVVGAALALGGGGGGGGDSNSSDALLPPTVNRLTATWSASASSLEQTSYTGTYTLYGDGTHSYDLQFSEGYRLTGRGRWEINAYQLILHNDTGSNYIGEFAPGNYRTIRLTTNGGWTLNLTKM